MTNDKIPSELRDLRQWCLWRIVERDGQATKVPFQTNGKPASSTDASTWTTFDAASKVAARFAGLGFVFAADDPFVGIDLDGCRDPESGKVSAWAVDIIKVLDSYSEVSPSQTGVKVWIRGKLPFANGKKAAVKADAVCDKAPAIEVYDHGRYFAVTGKRLSGISQTINDRQQQLDELCKTHFPEQATAAVTQDWHSEPAVVERARKYVTKLPASVSGQGGHNAAYHAACVLVLGFGLGSDAALALLREWNQLCQPPWSERELQHKINQAGKQGGERNYLRNAKPERYDAIPIPKYESNEKPTPEVRTTTLDAAARKYIEGIAADKQKLVSLSIPELDYAIGGGVEYGEMVILAARPSHGKSAVALQVVHHATGEGMPTCFISQEMSALALGKRTVQFASEIPQEHWRYQRADLSRQVEDHFAQRAACYIVESCTDANQAAEVIRRHVRDHGVRMAVVDYAQLLSGRGKDRYEKITNTSLALRQVASDTQIVLLVLCQLSREIEKRTKFQPVMSDLKETGQFEQDADVIVFLVWPHRLDERTSPDEYIFYVAKNRNRQINQSAVRCKFMPSRQMVVEDKPTYEHKTEFRSDVVSNCWEQLNPDDYPGRLA